MIIPIFVPHEGCPNDCAFCNQRTISGKSIAPTTDEARSTIEEYLSGGKTAEQIAFFGGSFTGIDVKKQNEYLSLAQDSKAAKQKNNYTKLLLISNFNRSFLILWNHA